MGTTGLTEQHRAATLSEIAAQVRTRLMNLEATLRQEIDAGTMVEFDGGVLTHLFAPGVYLRTLAFKAGETVIGKIHKHEHASILSKGELLLLTESGGLEHLVAPAQFVAPAGTKRAVHALTDCVWTTVHPNPTNETDLKKIEASVIAPSYEAYEQFLLEGKTMNKQIEVAA